LIKNQIVSHGSIFYKTIFQYVCLIKI